jgi:FMN-dependent oxidoreductase (nitrilotriacetate monooxygenase family)
VKPRMHLAFDLSYAHMDGRWRRSGSWTGRTYPDLGILQEIASISERGCIDMLFFGDGSGIPSSWRGSIDEAVRWGVGWPRQDMSPYIAALAQSTKHVGFGLTYSSTFMHPFYVARLLNSIDHVTNGRIAFNVITSTRRSDAANYGFDMLMEHSARYERMEEFIDVCMGLWDSIEPDSFVWNRQTGIVIEDPSKVKAINHAGTHFKVTGPLSCVPSPQRRPILIQAGGSPRGIRASAQFADVIFAAGKAIGEKKKHREMLDAELKKAGRHPAEVGILFSTPMVVGETEGEAIRRKEQLLEALPFEAAGAFLSHNAGYDFSRLPARFTCKTLNEEIAATNASPVGFVHELADRIGENAEITREEFFEHGMKAATFYDITRAGTATQLADELEEEFEATGSRGGFMIAHPQGTPRDVLNVVDFLVPELQRRGRFRTSYEGKTLRENLALDPVPTLSN